MVKEMIVASGDHETRVALLEDDEVVELFIERERQRGVVGNVYKGRVSKVLPGMQSSFIDIGLERDGFLYVSDVVNTMAAFDELASDDDDDETAAGGAANGQKARGQHREGDEAGAASGEGGDAGAGPDGADEAGGHHGAESSGGNGGAAPALAHGRPRRRSQADPNQPRIEELLKEGQEVIVQVAKEPLGTKGARLTSHVTIPGRFLVFMPTVDHVGVSRKIASREERARLRGIVKAFRAEHGFGGGVIIRTAAAGRPEADIIGDLKYFNDVWNDIRRRSESSRPPAVLYREQSLVAKLLRDLLTDEFSAIRIDNPLEYRRVLEFVERVMPSLAPRVKQYTKNYPIFDEYGVQSEIEKALRSKVWLKSGGYIVINHTEALVAIDVNTGRYVGKKSEARLEDTIVKTNLEAAREIVRQVRLRDLGGIIVLDFIDMEEKKNRQKVFQAVEAELRRDRAPSKAIQVQDFGLIVITRKRVKQSLERQLTEQCPYCTGAGTIKSASTVCYEILTELRKVKPDVNGRGVVLRVNPEIADALRGEEAAVLRDAERLFGKRLVLRPDPLLHHEQFDVTVV